MVHWGVANQSTSTGAYSAAWTLGASTPGYDGTLVALKAGAGGGADTTAPSVPGGLTVNPASDTAVALAWSPSSDNTAVQGYRVYRGGSLIATTASLSYLDPGRSASTAYSYTLAAIDGAGNASAQSSSVGTSTLTSGAGTAYAYAYDRDANRTSASQAGLTSTASYDRSGELISRTDAGVSTYLAYDAYGNQTSSAPAVNANTASTYDLADRLVSLTPPGQAATTFTFDALGRPLTRVTPAGTDAYEYVGTSQTAWRITRAGVATSSAIDPSGARLATLQSGTLGYLLADLHGNLAAVVNSGETALLSSTRYDPFGQTVAAADSGGAFPTPWRFQGRLDLSPDNHPLYAFGARNYDPGSGAFTSLDSYAGSPGDPLSLNRFAYAEANPWTLVDPDGHMPLPVGYDDQRGPVKPLPPTRPTPHSVPTEKGTGTLAEPPGGNGPHGARPSGPPDGRGPHPGPSHAPGQTSCVVAQLGGGLLLIALAPLDLALLLAAVPAAATGPGEAAVFFADAVALYATGQAIGLAKQGFEKPCSEIHLSLNPLDYFSEGTGSGP